MQHGVRHCLLLLTIVIAAGACGNADYATNPSESLAAGNLYSVSIQPAVREIIVALFLLATRRGGEKCTACSGLYLYATKN